MALIKAHTSTESQQFPLIQSNLIQYQTQYSLMLNHPELLNYNLSSTDIEATQSCNHS